MDILNNAKKHFQEISREMRAIEIPEWGEENNPAIIYSKPLNLTQQLEIMDLAEKGDKRESMFMTIYHMARNSDGTRLFQRSDKDTVLKEIDPDVIAKLVTELTKQITPEDIRKN